MNWNSRRFDFGSRASAPTPKSVVTHEQAIVYIDNRTRAWLHWFENGNQRGNWYGPDVDAASAIRAVRDDLAAKLELYDGSDEGVREVRRMLAKSVIEEQDVRKMRVQVGFSEYPERERFVLPSLSFRDRHQRENDRFRDTVRFNERLGLFEDRTEERY